MPPVPMRKKAMSCAAAAPASPSTSAAPSSLRMGIRASVGARNAGAEATLKHYCVMWNRHRTGTGPRVEKIRFVSPPFRP